MSSKSGRVVSGVLVAVAAAVLVGLIVFWPSADRARVGALPPGEVVSATVERVSGEGCETFAGQGCQMAIVTLTSGLEAGQASYLALPSTQFAPALRPGDDVRVARNTSPDRPPPALDDLERQPLSFVDFERGRALLVLALVFAVLVVGLARWQGLRSLIGVTLSLLIVIGWLVPSILSGHPPLAAGLIGGLAVMLATTTLTHGLGLKSAAAMLGATATIGLIVALGALAVEFAHITGMSSDEAAVIDARGQSQISIQGLVLAGIVIGALGVLDDLTISQSSTVLALRRASPEMRAGRIFREAMVVGRDHLGATVNTLVLAYAGASLPVLLVLAGQGTGFFDALELEQVANVVVAILVGSTGLLAAVPLTTWLAALLAVRTPARHLAQQHMH